MVKSSQKKALNSTPQQWLQKCTVLSKVPSTNPHAANMDKDDADLAMKAFKKAVYLLWVNPKQSLACFSWLETRVDSEAQRDDTLKTAGDGSSFVEAPEAVNAIEDDWMVQYILGAGLGYTSAQLGKALAYSKDQIGKIFMQILNVTGTLVLGADCRNKAILKTACDLRKAEYNFTFYRTDSCAADAMVSGDGMVQWDMMPNYDTVTWEEGKLKVVVHRPTGHQAEVTSVIDDSWWMDYAWSDRRCVMMKSKTDRHALCDYFPPGRGPHMCPTLKGKSKRWNELVNRAKVAITSKCQELQVGTFAKPDDSFMTPQKTKAEDMAKKARESLKRRMEERAVKRRVGLKAPESSG